MANANRRLNDASSSPITPLRRAERRAAVHREALLRTVLSLEERLSPTAIKRRATRAIRRQPLQVAAAVGAFTVTGFALARLLRAERAPAEPEFPRRVDVEWR